MSATPTMVHMPRDPMPAVPAEARGKRKAKKTQSAAPLLRKPSAHAMHLLRQTASTLLAEGFGYYDATELVKRYLADVALLLDNGVQKAAAKRLGISRNYVHEYRERAKEVIG